MMKNMLPIACDMTLMEDQVLLLVWPNDISLIDIKGKQPFAYKEIDLM